MPDQTFDITAPDGKKLTITGDHVPSESELQDIFKSAGVSTSTMPASAGPFDTSQMSGDAIPSAGEFGKRMINAAVDVPVGMVKRAARLGQMIPGVAAATDAVYGLPSGASEKSAQSENPSQTAGGLIADAYAVSALPAGSSTLKGAPVRLPSGRFAAGPVVTTAETVGSRVPSALGDVTMKTVQAVKDQVVGSGPVTTDKVAAAVARYGINAVKLALGGKIFGEFMK